MSYPSDDRLEELATRLTYLEAFSISCFIMLKERMRRGGEDETRFGSEFQAVFQEAMTFLDSEGETCQEDWSDALRLLIRKVERGEDRGLTRW